MDRYWDVIIINGMNTLYEEPVDFDRLMLKTGIKLDAPKSPQTSERPQESPLDLIRALTSQFKTHFQ